MDTGQSLHFKPEKVKPLLRGVSHFLAFFLALGGFVFLAMAPVEGRQYQAGILYGVSLVLLFGLSALYHRPMWSLAMRRRLRKVDHSCIALLIAGTYTPMAVLDGRGVWTVGLSVMWGGAFLVLMVAVFFSYTLRGVRTGLYIALGFVAFPVVTRLPGLIGMPSVMWLIAGAAVYLLGAIVYATRWPNPAPKVFGYHEVFHLLVIIAAAIQFGVVLDVQYRL
jgi:hemolysin III